ncbi:hypothetical protein BH23BAC4_BH23BAC4_09290 [soil metagenome]
MNTLILGLLLSAGFQSLESVATDSTVVEVGPERTALRTPPSLAATRIQFGEIRIDGRMDEPLWETAPVATGFIQRQPEPGMAATERTEVRVLYDDQALYVGFRMHDASPQLIQAQLARRDTDVASDWALVGIDSQSDRRTAFVFGVNAAGVQRDFLLYNDVREDTSWDAVWQSAVSIDEHGWTAELRIPLSQLRFSPSADAPWGLQFGRHIGRKGEDTFWAPFLPDAPGFVSQFGYLTDLQNLSRPRGLEIRPYIASRLTRAPGEEDNPFYSANQLRADVGMDVKYRLGSNLNLTATVNPDFGQVEADPAQVNLSAFELFLEERRPFFVEGTDIFNFGRTRSFIQINPPTFLYTRRIGRAPQRTAFVPGEAYDAGTVYTDSPTQTPILGALKVSGRVGQWNLGLLNAVTSNQRGRYTSIGPDGPVLEGDALVEPLTNYLAGRAQRQFGQTLVGGMVSAVNRSTDDPAIRSLLPAASYVGGADFEHSFGDRAWTVNGVFAATHNSGNPLAISRLQRSPAHYFQRPDAGHLEFDADRTSLSGLHAQMSVARTSGTHWIGSAMFATNSPGFDANALGFNGRSDQHVAGGVLIYQQPSPQGIFSNWNANVHTFGQWNYDGDRVNSTIGLEGSARFRNYWTMNGNLQYRMKAIDDRATRGGPNSATTPTLSMSLSGGTDPRLPVRFFASQNNIFNADGGRNHGGSFSVRARPTTNFDFTLSPAISFNDWRAQYVGARPDAAADQTFGTRYLFSDIEQLTASISARVNWTFSPTLSLQVFARPYVSVNRFSGYKELAAPRTRDFVRYGADRGTIVQDGNSFIIDPGDGGESFRITDPSFTLRSVQGNAVLRWEYRPGSTFFLVWQQLRTGFLDDQVLDPSPHFGRMWSDPVQNVFLAKFTYWFGT